jgi:hypothetical protein
MCRSASASEHVMARRIGFFPLMGTSFAFTVTLLAPPSARAQGATPSAAPAAAAAPCMVATTIDRIARLLEERYVVPPLGRRYAATLRTNAKAGRYAGIADPAALGARITTDLQAVAADGHLRVRPPHGEGGPRLSAAASPAATAGVAPGIREARWLEPGIAYIAFDHFSDDPAALTALTGFLRDHRDAKALVIDARDHRGGSFPMLASFGDRLFGTARHLADMDVAQKVVAEAGVPFPEGPELRRVAAPAGLVRYQHWSVPASDGATLFDVPVYYLTSRRTYSAAEHMAMMLKTTRRATLVGEPTGGGNHFGGTEDVGCGLEMFVPIGRTTDPATGADWEAQGVKPDVAVPADEALDATVRLVRGDRPPVPSAP